MDDLLFCVTYEILKIWTQKKKKVVHVNDDINFNHNNITKIIWVVQKNTSYQILNLKYFLTLNNCLTYYTHILLMSKITLGPWLQTGLQIRPQNIFRWGLCLLLRSICLSWIKSLLNLLTVLLSLVIYRCVFIHL